MQFGLNEMCFPYDDRTESIELAADAGYDGIELTLTPDGALDSPTKREQLRTAAADNDLSVPSLIGAHFWEYPLSSPDEKTREQGLEYSRALLDAAVEFDADRVLVIPGVVDETTPYDEAYDTALASLRELAADAAERDVTLALENVWNDFLLSPLEFASFVDEAATAGPVGAYFDVGNVVRTGYPEQWIRILDDRIAAIHVKDFRTAVDTIDGFTYPLQGDVDWGAVATALDDIGYDGWVIPEVSPYETDGERMPGQVLGNIQSVF